MVNRDSCSTCELTTETSIIRYLIYKPINKIMNEVRAQIVIMSHLSDASIELNLNPEQAQKRIEFAKFLINQLNGDLTKKIEPNKYWDMFIGISILKNGKGE